MSKTKRSHSSAFKAKVALAAVREKLTLARITSKHEIHATQVNKWKLVALEAIQQCFSKTQERHKIEQERLTAKLYEQIGRLQTELNWLKKKCSVDV